MYASPEAACPSTAAADLPNPLPLIEGLKVSYHKQEAPAVPNPSLHTLAMKGALDVRFCECCNNISGMHSFLSTSLPPVLLRAPAIRWRFPAKCIQAALHRRRRQRGLKGNGPAQQQDLVHRETGDFSEHIPKSVGVLYVVEVLQRLQPKPGPPPSIPYQDPPCIH